MTSQYGAYALYAGLARLHALASQRQQWFANVPQCYVIRTLPLFVYYNLKYTACFCKILSVYYQQLHIMQPIKLHVKLKQVKCKILSKIKSNPDKFRCLTNLDVTPWRWWCRGTETCREFDFYCNLLISNFRCNCTRCITYNWFNTMSVVWWHRYCRYWLS